MLLLECIYLLILKHCHIKASYNYFESNKYLNERSNDQLAHTKPSRFIRSFFRSFIRVRWANERTKSDRFPRTP